MTDWKEKVRAMSDQELLEEIADAADAFRNAVIKGDTDWVYKRITTEASELSGRLCEGLVERIRRQKGSE